MTAPGGAAIVEDPDLEPARRLAVALERSGALDALGALGAPTGDDASPASSTILILPELGGFEPGSPTATDPRLVEALVDLLHDAGHPSVVVGGSADSSSLWAGNRDVYALADLLGYRYVTAAGREYDIVDLADDLVAAPFEQGGVLTGSPLSRAWLDAGYRIVFTKNRTDEADGYRLALDTVLRALPLSDEDYHYRLARPVDVVVAELLRCTPVDLTLIDAVVSSDGSGGTRAPHPVATRCVIAAHDIWLADAIGAIKMGLDPSVSRLFGRAPALDVDAAPIQGELSVYPGWRSPHPLILRSTRARDASPTWMRLVRPWLQVLDEEAFPLESPLDARVNERLAPLFARVDDDPAAFSALIAANTALAGAHEAIERYRILFSKDAVRQVPAPLGFDPADHPPGSYAAIVAELERLRQLMSGAREHAPGLRWRELDRAVLFDYRRLVPIPFDEFVGAVDVARTISYMNDYLGGVVVPIEHDADGRVVRQAERNLYLPQPNYVVLWGGQPIDVGKLEVVSYAPDTHRMYWKTVVSENGSAVYDDGIVTFTAAGADQGGSPVGSTLVTIFGRQRFTLPPALEAIDLELVPELRHRLVTDAYRTFFDRTLANLEALVEGREIRIGRPWAASDTRMAGEPLPSETLERLIEEGLDRVQSALGTVRTARAPQARTPQPLEVDADGFAHFRPADRAEPAPPSTSPLTEAVVRFWAGLVEAGLRDVQRQTRVGA